MLFFIMIPFINNAFSPISSPDMAAKNLRSKKGSEASNDLAEDNLEQIRFLIASLTDKIDKLMQVQL